MPKSTRRGRRKTPNALRRTRSERQLLERILDTPHLARIVPQLQPEVLHRVIQTCGLEDCGEIVALATSDQLERVLDLDLWRSDRPGLDEQLDADRFGVWLEVLMEAGASAAAGKIVGMKVDLVIAALAQHVLVVDRAAVSSYTTTDGEVIAPRHRMSGGPHCEVGSYVVEARRTSSWDAIAAVLLALDAGHPDYFRRVMRGCRNLSNSGAEVDGLHDLLTDSDQDMFDLAFDREQRREKSGYVTPAQARAFLKMARQVQLGHKTMPPPNPIATASFRAVEWTKPADEGAAAQGVETHALIDSLREAGVLPQQPRALLNGPQGAAPRLASIYAHMASVNDRDPAAYSTMTEELAYLANAMVAGCSIQARPFTEREASEAVVAVCNLGLENWPRHWPADHGLVSVFQVGWTVLHDDVCMYAAEQLIGVLTDLRSDDREIRSGLHALRVDLRKHWRAGTPWRARDALDVMAILDLPAWAALLGLIDQCPVMHAAVHAAHDTRTLAVSASAFEFISENSQIATIREFMQSLPETLRS
jgi:Family of unknown function (DUF6178)